MNRANSKTSKRFRPKVVPTLVMLPMLAVLVSLGNWQARRFSETSDKVAQYRRQHDELPPVTSLDVAGPAEKRVETLHFRRAALKGQVDVSQVQLLTARYKLGQRGWGILVPLQVATGSYPKILVHLGWVPLDKLDEYLASLKTQPPSQFGGRLRAVADVEPNQVPASTHQGKQVWMVANPPALTKHIAGLDPRMMLDVGEQAVGNPLTISNFPLDGYEYPVHPLPTKHIEYAATWYGLAATLVAVWVALSRQKVDDAVAEPTQAA